MKTVVEPICFVADTELNDRLAEAMLSLHIGAKADKLAETLEMQRHEFFEELYNFSYGVNVLEEGQRASNRTDDIAIAIIFQKELYNKRIVRLRLRYERFQRLLDRMKEPDKELIMAYFMNCNKVNYEILLACLLRNLDIIEGFYKSNEQQKDRVAIIKLREYQRLNDRFV